MSKAEDLAMQAAETIQTAHINPFPSVEDIAPSTSADSTQHVEFDDSLDLDDVSDVDDEIPVSVLRPTPRSKQMPPLPDLRFEQSYLTSIKNANGWSGVAYITVKDQVLMPLVQGLAWTLIVAGWRHWNAAAQFSGNTIGARVRRWWWDVNNWKVPDKGPHTLRDEKAARKFSEYVKQYSTAGSD